MNEEKNSSTQQSMSQVETQEQVLYQNVFHLQHLGRISDLVVSELKKRKVDEFRFRALLLYQMMAAYRAQISEEDYFSSDFISVPVPIEIEIGFLEKDQFFIQVSFASTKEVFSEKTVFEELEKKMPSTSFLRFLKYVCKISDQIWMVTDSEKNKYILKALMEKKEAQKQDPIAKKLHVEIISDFSKAKQFVHSEHVKSTYKALSELNFEPLLKADLQGIEKEVVYQSGNFLEEKQGSIKVKGKEEGLEEKKVISGGQIPLDEKIIVSGSGEKLQDEKQVVRGKVSVEDQKAQVIHGKKGEKEEVLKIRGKKEEKEKSYVVSGKATSEEEKEAVIPYKSPTSESYAQENALLKKKIRAYELQMQKMKEQRHDTETKEKHMPKKESSLEKPTEKKKGFFKKLWSFRKQENEKEKVKEQGKEINKTVVSPPLPPTSSASRGVFDGSRSSKESLLGQTKETETEKVAFQALEKDSKKTIPDTEAVKTQEEEKIGQDEEVTKSLETLEHEMSHGSFDQSVKKLEKVFIKASDAFKKNEKIKKHFQNLLSHFLQEKAKLVEHAIYLKHEVLQRAHAFQKKEQDFLVQVSALRKKLEIKEKQQEQIKKKLIQSQERVLDFRKSQNEMKDMEGYQRKWELEVTRKKQLEEQKNRFQKRVEELENQLKKEKVSQKESNQLLRDRVELTQVRKQHEQMQHQMDEYRKKSQSLLMKVMNYEKKIQLDVSGMQKLQDKNKSLNEVILQKKHEIEKVKMKLRESVAKERQLVAENRKLKVHLKMAEQNRKNVA